MSFSSLITGMDIWLVLLLMLKCFYKFWILIRRHYFWRSWWNAVSLLQLIPKRLLDSILLSWKFKIMFEAWSLFPLMVLFFLKMHYIHIGVRWRQVYKDVQIHIIWSTHWYPCSLETYWPWHPSAFLRRINGRSTLYSLFFLSSFECIYVLK